MSNRGTLFIAAIATALSAAACGGAASQSASNAPVEILQTQKLVLRGTADASLTSATCQPAAPSSPKHLLELRESTTGTMRIRPAMGDTQLVAVLHVTHVDSNRTWCVTSGGASNGTIEGNFPGGTYAISVAEPRAEVAHRYEVVVEQL
jgi:hypothetical protein